MDETIICVECSGTAHLVLRPPDEGFEPGDILVYRCEDCLDRWDIVYEEEITEG
ncbi:hypothetical protein BMS3Abin02_00907 [bacterium BMS3Abin02]|nr:hypothetical protein BMS3Abin02_00907 [bacterium BMS3Abin02]GBE21638.1 hypothetical protein BMS3Bbin01_00983 [bacterium BMS3Bbin01]